MHRLRTLVFLAALALTAQERARIFRITPVRTAAGSTALRRVKVEMYLQEVAVDFIDAKG